MFQLDYSDHRPIYEQIKDKLILLIISGVLKENDKIPSVRELAGTLAINPNTIQKAYRDLETDGYIYSLRAKGSFVAPRAFAQNKTDTDELLSEYKEIIKKLNYFGKSYDSLLKILDEEYAKGCENL